MKAASRRQAKRQGKVEEIDYCKWSSEALRVMKEVAN